jgi:NAD-reducing hydrogenase small subunit
MSKKVTIATDWLEACAGCHMSFLDLDERLIELLKYIEITSSPITDLKHPPEDGVDVGILTGGWCRCRNTHGCYWQYRPGESCKRDA